MLSRQGLWAGRKVECTSVAVFVMYCISFIISFVFTFLIILLFILTAPCFRLLTVTKISIIIVIIIIIIIIIILGQRHPVTLVNQ